MSFSDWLLYLLLLRLHRSTPRRSSAASDVSKGQDLYRALEPTILLANTHKLAPIPRESFATSMVALAADANLCSDDFHISGNIIDSRFEIKFSGSIESAASKAKQFVQSLQLGKGVWKRQQAPDETGNLVTFYLGTDKNPKGVRREIMGKALRDLVQAAIPAEPKRTVVLSKATGTLYCERKKICTLHLVSDAEWRIDWYQDQRVRLGLTEDGIGGAFARHQAEREAQRL